MKIWTKKNEKNFHKCSEHLAFVHGSLIRNKINQSYYLAIEKELMRMVISGIGVRWNNADMYETCQ